MQPAVRANVRTAIPVGLTMDQSHSFLSRHSASVFAVRTFAAAMVALSIALLLAGGLGALQAMAVSTGFPFTIVLLGACYAIVKGLMGERREVRSAD